MLLQLDFSIDTPIYSQIHDQLVLGIADGRLLPGEKLPAIRSLAIETGVNMMTVNKAYQLLKQEGYITTDRRGGTVVLGPNETIPDQISGRILEEKALSELLLPAASAKLAGISRENWLKLCKAAFDGQTEKINKE